MPFLIYYFITEINIIKINTLFNKMKHGYDVSMTSLKRHILQLKELCFTRRNCVTEI